MIYIKFGEALEMETMTPTRAYHDQRGRDRRAPAPQGPARQVPARGASALARERAYAAAAPAPAPMANDEDADWDAGFDMFVEKCSFQCGPFVRNSHLLRATHCNALRYSHCRAWHLNTNTT